MSKEEIQEAVKEYLRDNLQIDYTWIDEDIKIVLLLNEEIISEFTLPQQ